MLKFILTVGLLVAIIFGGYLLYTETDLFRISTIEFNENTNMDLYEVQRYSGVTLGMPYFTVNPRVASVNLESHPYVKMVKAHKSFPGKLIFEIEYREHAFNVIYSDIILSLDEQLHVLKVLDEPEEGYTVEGFAFDSFSTGELIQVSRRYLLENIVLLIQLFEKSHVELIPDIFYEDEGIAVRLNEIKVKFGNGENIEDKFNDFISIYDYLEGEEITTGIIDVSSDGLPVYKPFGE